MRSREEPLAVASADTQPRSPLVPSRNYLSAHIKAEHEELHKELCAATSLVRYDCDWPGW